MELDQKKLKLTKLQQLKMQAEEQAHKRAAKQEAAQQSAMLAKLVATAKILAGAKNASASDAAALKPVLENLQGRMHNVTEELGVMDEAEKKLEAQMKEAVEGKMLKHVDAEKKAKMMKIVMKGEIRKYKKARARKQAELSDLKDAVTDIEKGDAAGLQKVMNRLQRAQSSSEGGFIY